MDYENINSTEKETSESSEQTNKYSSARIMNNSAGIAKRLFSQLLDFMLVCLVTLVLYLVPFQFIINAAIDPHYRDNVKKPYDAITEKYSGTTSLLGTTTNGIYTDFNALYDSSTKELTLSKENYDKYTGYMDDAYDRVMADINKLLEKMDVEYSKEESPEKQFSALLYQIY